VGVELNTQGINQPAPHYQNKFVDLSMPGYIKAALHNFQHPTTTRPKNAPHTWNPPVYEAKTQYIEAQENNPLLPQKYVTRIQQLAGALL
jgi:hypothetical protein